MPVKISEEKRHKIIQRMILEGNVDKIAHDEEVSESTVRNVWSEAKSGVYPEYTGFIPIVDALRRLNEDLGKAGVTVAQAATGLTIFIALGALGIEIVRLPQIVGMLKSIAGDRPPQGFGRAVEELAKLHAEAGLDFQQLEKLVTAKRSELEDVQTKVKGAGVELESVRSKIMEAKEELSRTLKQNSATFEDIKQYGESRRVLREAGFSFDDVNSLVDFLKTTRADGFLQASKELAALQKETGLDCKRIAQEYKKTQGDIDELRKEETRLTKEINGLTIKVADLKKQAADQLVENGMTKDRLDRLSSVIDRLKKGGIDLE
ncbi:MAG: hypothetical protein ABSA92_04815 [Candidatus Bathyarchaeia archaeon]